MKKEAVRRPARLVVSVALAFLALTAVAPPPASAARPLERKLLGFINTAREEAGRQPLRMRDSLTDAARRHSRRMAAAGEWFHSDGLPGGLLGGVWSLLGENVGRAPSVSSMHQWFMGSFLHRGNILSRRFDRVGVGIVVRDGTHWVTEIFVG